MGVMAAKLAHHAAQQVRLADAGRPAEQYWRSLMAATAGQLGRVKRPLVAWPDDKRLQHGDSAATRVFNCFKSARVCCRTRGAAVEFLGAFRRLVAGWGQGG